MAGALAFASSEQLAFAGSHLTRLCLVPCCKQLLGQEEGQEEDKGDAGVSEVQSLLRMEVAPPDS